jgi:uncharacterized membrane protein YedE/YeeE
MSTITIPQAPISTSNIQLKAVIPALLVLAAGALYIAQTVKGRQSLLFLLGALAGLILYHAAFGFTSSWRVFIAHRKGAGLRAQMLMLAVATVLFVPALASGALFGQTVRGSISPVGLAVIAGAFMFGAGMQLGGGCASGTLYAAGGGSVRMLVTLAMFIAGSVIGTLHAAWWAKTPTFKAFSMLDQFGALPALALSLGAFAFVWELTTILERRRHGRLMPEPPRGSLLRGPWPLVWGAIGLALVNFGALALSGRPWGITGAFALWGSKILAAFGVNVAAWPYWLDATRAPQLKASVFADVTSVMNFGIIIGAFIAAGLAGKLSGEWRVPAKSLLAAVVGGLVMGYGARIGFGCNIGAYFGGVISTSLHGWLWLVAALAGSVLGTRMRPWFGLSV